MTMFLALLFSVIVGIHCSAVLALPAGLNSTSSGIVAGANTTNSGTLGVTNFTAPGAVDGSSSAIPSNQSTQTTPAPTAGSPPPIVLQGSVSILPPFPQQAQQACPQMCQSNQGCHPPCPRPCCPQQQPPQYGRSAVPHATNCQCQEKCQASHRNKRKCLVRCERVCERKESISAFSSKKHENKKRFYSKISKIRKNREVIGTERLIRIKL